MGDTFSYRITLENGSGDIIPPNLGDFTVIFGPARSSNYRLINGQQSSTLTLTYTMRPRKVGKFTIGSGKVVIDGKTLKTQPIEVEVFAQGSTKPMQTQSSGKQKSNIKPETSDGSENLQVIISLNKSNVFVGEQIVAQYILLTRYSNIDISETKLPSPSGFWTEDVKGDPAWERNYEMIDGVPYRKAVLKTQILIPQRAGKLTIDPIEIKALVNRSIFNRGTEYSVKSKSPVINVKAHPGKAPTSYNGAVGELKYNVDVNRNEIDANEAIELKISISGIGNLSLISEPNIQFPADFEVYDPEINDRTSVSESGISGSRTFQYLIIPRYPGDYEIPKFDFTFFSPRKGKYITKSAGPYIIKVNGEGGFAPSPQGGVRSQNRVTESGSDIRYIVNDPNLLEPTEDHFYGSALFGFLLFSPFVGFLFFLFFRKHSEDRNKDKRLVKKRNANKLARRRLRAAAKALKSNDSAAFYSEIFNALYGYLGDRLGLDGSQLSRVIIFNKLKEQQIEKGVIDNLAETLDTCEMARFAPAANTSEQAFYDQTVKLIETLESQLK